MAGTSPAMTPSKYAMETRLLRTMAPGVPSIEIGILEKRSPVLDLRLPPMLLVHGATFGARLFDLPRVGYSLMAALGSDGRVVYAIASAGNAVKPTRIDLCVQRGQRYQARFQTPDVRDRFIHAGKWRILRRQFFHGSATKRGSKPLMSRA